MEWKEVRKLADKYFAGETSLAEESELRRLLESESLPGDLHLLRTMLNVFESEGRLKSRLSANDIAGTAKSERRTVPRQRIWLAAAAALLIGLISFFWLQKSEEKPEVVLAYVNGVAITDEQQAMEEAKKALNLLTSNLNQGTDKLDYLGEINRTEQLLIKNQ